MGEPILIFSESPTHCSDAILALVSLISPVCLSHVSHLYTLNINFNFFIFISELSSSLFMGETFDHFLPSTILIIKNSPNSICRPWFVAVFLLLLSSFSLLLLLNLCLSIVAANIYRHYNDSQRVIP